MSNGFNGVNVSNGSQTETHTTWLDSTLISAIQQLLANLTNMAFQPKDMAFRPYGILATRYGILARIERAFGRWVVKRDGEGDCSR